MTSLPVPQSLAPLSEPSISRNLFPLSRTITFHPLHACANLRPTQLLESSRSLYKVFPGSSQSLSEVFPSVNGLKVRVLHIIKSTISITRVSDISENSFLFEDSIRKNRFGSGKIGLVAEEGRPLLLKLENCLAYGINKNNKFGKDNYTIPLAVGAHTEFVSALETLGKKCAAAVGKPDTNVMRCLYRNGKQSVLYAKINRCTAMYREDGGGDMNPMEQRDGHFYLDALIRISSIYLSGSMVSVQVKLQEAKCLREKVAEPRKRLLKTR